ncbi:MAG: NVEALA domain-containing protein [Bacteroides sp.]|nr:NVEALA domain-containing protein [Bacteroides sp.]
MKKVTKYAFIAVFAAVAGYGIYMNQETDSMSDIMLANVEALAGTEISNPNCEPSWEKECCVCFSVHHTYARRKVEVVTDNCETRTNCSHY